MNRKLLFIHIPRTSGRMMIETFFKPKECYKIVPRKKVTMLPMNRIIYYGHIPLGFEKTYFKPKNIKWQYITFIREPISRWISIFNYTVTKKYKSKKFQYRTNMWKSCNYNIVSFLEMCLKSNIGTNIMVKQLGGGMKDFRITLGNRNTTRAYVWGKRKYVQNYETLQSYCDMAIQNLAKFNFVGHPHVESHQRFCEKYGLTHVQKTLNISRKTVDVDWDRSLVQELLYEINKYDLMLWQNAREKGYV